MKISITKLRRELIERIDRPKLWNCTETSYKELSEDNALIMKTLLILLSTEKNLP